jgi:hypothetical protein
MTAFSAGDSVVISFNPHHEDSADIVGTVVSFHPGAGFMGCDLVYVRYQRPGDGAVHEMPFATYNLELGSRESLLARAARHEEQAVKLWAMAEGMAMSRVPVPRAVHDGIVAVRDSGLTNMLDRPRVTELAESLAFMEAAQWIGANPGLYARGVDRGFQATDEN